MEDPAGFDASEHSDILVLRGENRALPDLENRLPDPEIAARGLDAEGVVRRRRVLRRAGNFSRGCSVS